MDMQARESTRNSQAKAEALDFQQFARTAHFFSGMAEIPFRLKKICSLQLVNL